MLASFRARLIVGFALVIALALFLSASGFVLLLRQEQNQAAEQRIGLLVGPISEGTRNLQQAGWPAAVIRSQLVEVADHYQFRVLMVDQQQRVVMDTALDESLLGQTLEVLQGPPSGPRGDEMDSFRSYRETRDGRDYGEIESGAVRMEIEDVAIDDLVEATVPRLRHQAEEAEVGLAAQPGAGATVRADGRRIEQVLANLVDNAIRFARRGSDVTITSKAVAGGVLVDVHNEGDPLPEDVRARVFDRFYQADAARSGGRHRGLGLSIVQELVQAHGGTVAVESTAGAGTTFSVFLPAGGPTKPTSVPPAR